MPGAVNCGREYLAIDYSVFFEGKKEKKKKDARIKLENLSWNHSQYECSCFCVLECLVARITAASVPELLLDVIPGIQSSGSECVERSPG
jgi:hypothetical protein